MKTPKSIPCQKVNIENLKTSSGITCFKCLNFSASPTEEEIKHTPPNHSVFNRTSNETTVSWHPKVNSLSFTGGALLWQRSGRAAQQTLCCVQEQSGNDSVNWKHRLRDVRFVDSAGANVQGAQVTIWGANSGNRYPKRFSISKVRRNLPNQNGSQQ